MTKIILGDIFKPKRIKGDPLKPKGFIMDNEIGHLWSHAKQLNEERKQLLAIAEWALQSVSAYNKRSETYDKALEYIKGVKD